MVKVNINPQYHIFCDWKGINFDNLIPFAERLFMYNNRTSKFHYF